MPKKRSKGSGPAPGKILRGLAGQGEVSNTALVARARDIARVEHPESPRPRASDLRRARRELQGEDVGLSVDEAPPARRRTRNPAEPAVSLGTQAPESLPEDDVQTERLVKEGLSEAEHDRRRAVRNTSPPLEGGPRAERRTKSAPRRRAK